MKTYHKENAAWIARKPRKKPSLDHPLRSINYKSTDDPKARRKYMQSEGLALYEEIDGEEEE